MRKKLSVLGILFMLVVKHPPMTTFSIFSKIQTYMYIFSLTQFLDENEDLRKDLTEEGIEMACFLTLLVETATKEYPAGFISLLQNKVHLMVALSPIEKIKLIRKGLIEQMGPYC